MILVIRTVAALMLIVASKVSLPPSLQGRGRFEPRCCSNPPWRGPPNTHPEHGFGYTRTSPPHTLQSLQRQVVRQDVQEGSVGRSQSAPHLAIYLKLDFVRHWVLSGLVPGCSFPKPLYWRSFSAESSFSFVFIVSFVVPQR